MGSAESIKKDKMQRILGGKEFFADEEAVLVRDGAESRWLVNDDTDNRVLVGQREDGSWGIDASQEGYNVLTAEDDELSMSSKFNMFKITQSGSSTITCNFLSYTIDGMWQQFFIDTINHNLGYRPSTFLYLEEDDEYRKVPFYYHDLMGSDYDKVAASAGFDVYATYKCFFYVTTTQLVLTYRRIFFIGGGATVPADSKGTLSYKYYFCRETA